MYSNADYLYFDIETIPCQSKEYNDLLASEIVPPGNIKKQESIDKWLADNREDAAKQKVSKTSFDGGRGHVCTISWARNDDDITSRHASSIDMEYDVIKDFFKAIDPYHSAILVGHYITGFDIRFLIKRAVILGINLPPASSFPRDPKPWDRGTFDTMTAWAGVKDSISMDNLCDILGIPSKGGFDGSMVADAWSNGKHQLIAQYCRDDVHRTRLIHQKFMKAGF